MQFVFEEGHFGIEQDRVGSGEFGDGDRVAGIVGVGVCPYLGVGCGGEVGVVAGIGRRVRPVVRFRGDGSREGEIRTGICADGWA